MYNKKQRKKPDLKRTAKNIGKAGAGAGLAVSMFFGSLFSSPAEIISPEDAAPPPAIVQEMAAPEEPAAFALDTEVAEEKRTLKDRLKALLIKMPIGLRIALLLPMWAVGYAILWAFSALGTLIGVPIIGDVIKFIIGALVIFGLVLLGLKLIFPDTPVKELVSKKNIIALAVCAGVIALAGALGGRLWKDTPYVTVLIDLGAAALYLLFFVLFVRKKKAERSA